MSKFFRPILNIKYFVSLLMNRSQSYRSFFKRILDPTSYINKSYEYKLTGVSNIEKFQILHQHNFFVFDYLPYKRVAKKHKTYYSREALVCFIQKDLIKDLLRIPKIIIVLHDLYPQNSRYYADGKWNDLNNKYFQIDFTFKFNLHNGNPRISRGETVVNHEHDAVFLQDLFDNDTDIIYNFQKEYSQVSIIHRDFKKSHILKKCIKMVKEERSAYGGVPEGPVAPVGPVGPIPPSTPSTPSCPGTPCGPSGPCGPIGP